MNKYNLADKEDLWLRFSIVLPGSRSLYEYLCELPLENLKAYPQKGYCRWMGQESRSAQALALRDYILYWRLRALAFRRQYSREYLETLSPHNIRRFLRTYIQKVPLWAYEEPLKDGMQLLFADPAPEPQRQLF